MGGDFWSGYSNKVNFALSDDANRRVQELKAKQLAEQSKPKGNFLTNLLPSAGGVGGSLAGAAGGAAIGSVVPVVGTALGGLIGALLGGAGGSALGKVGENAVEGESDLGKGVGQEALFGGLTSLPLTAGFKLARAGVKVGTGLGRKAAGDLVQEAGASTIGKSANKTLLNNSVTGTGRQADTTYLNTLQRLGGNPTIDAAGVKVATNTVQPSRLGSLGQDMQRRVANTSKVADSFTQENDILGALNRNGITGSASNMYRTVDGKLGELSNQIQDKLGTISKTTPRPTVINTLKSAVTDTLPDDATYTREIARSLDRLGKSGAGDVTASELFNFKKTLGNTLSPAFKKLDRGASLTAKEEVDMALWRNLDNEITRIAPGVKDLTRDQSMLITARPGLQSASNKTAGVPILGVKSQKLEQGLQAGRNFLGNRMNGGVANVTGAPKQVGQGLLGTLTRQGLGRSLVGGEQQQAGLNQATDPSMLGSDLPVDSGVQQQEQMNPTGYSSDQIAQAYSQAVMSGDTKAASQLQDLYSLASEYEKNASPAEKPLSAEASKTLANANSGLDSLGQLETLLSNNGGEVSKATLLPGRDLFGGALGNLTGTAQYDTINRNISDVITRLRTGAALTDQESRFYLSQLPQAFDNPDTIATKLKTFRDLFTSVASRTGSAGNDTQAAVLGQ